MAAIFSCKFLIDVDVAGIVCDGLWIGGLAKNCIHIQRLNLCGVFDKDMTGWHLLPLTTCTELYELSVSCWDELCDEAVIRLVSGCCSLRHMLVSHCTRLTLTADVASSLRPVPSPFRFLSDPRCTPWCLPPLKLCGGVAVRSLRQNLSNRTIVSKQTFL